MKIKDGYNNKESQIKIQANPNGSIELWIVHSGMESEQRNEIMVYITPDELLSLSQEVRLAARDLYGF